MVHTARNSLAGQAGSSPARRARNTLARKARTTLARKARTNPARKAGSSPARTPCRRVVRTAGSLVSRLVRWVRLSLELPGHMRSRQPAATVRVGTPTPRAGQLQSEATTAGPRQVAVAG